MPRIECDEVETALLDAWALVDSCLTEKAADLQRQASRAGSLERAQASLWECGLEEEQRLAVRAILTRLAEDLGQRDGLRPESVKAAELQLLNRSLYERQRAVVLIGRVRGLGVPPDARFWREGEKNLLVVAWGEDALSCDPAHPRAVAG